MQLCSIASGSSGNCIYVGDGDTHLLIDTGISGKRIENGLKEIGVSPEQISAVLITHEHTDHISGLGVMARRYQFPIYATEKTIEEIKGTKQIGKIEEECFVPIDANSKFKIGTIKVHAFPIYHDAADPVAYRFGTAGKSMGILTDCGTYDERIISCLQGVDVLLLEANHDVHMLQVGSYPYALKRRILSEKGHLSNECSGQLLCELLTSNLKYVLLGHLSKENNFEELAYETVRAEVDLSDCNYSSADFKLMVAKRDCVSEIITI